MTHERPSEPDIVGVFLSHASTDKPFVRRLAIDLIHRGIPVWFDRWELDTGDSLLRSIAKGIDDSTRLVLILSQSSVNSPWVKKEIDLGLAKEMERQQTYLLPIRIDDCAIPALLKDKIHADFRDRSAYYGSLDQLVATLQRSGAADLVPHPSHELIPFEIKEGLYLVKAGLANRLNRLYQRIPADVSLSENQIVFGDDDQYNKLRAHYQRLLVDAGQPPDGKYDAELHNSLEELNQHFFLYDRILHEGILEILNGLRKSHDGLSISETCFWFIKLARSRTLLRAIHVHGSLRLPASPEYLWALNLHPLHPYDSESVKGFYGIEDEAYCDVWIPGHKVFKVSLDANSSDARDITRFTPAARGQLRLVQEVFPASLLKFVIPKMVYDHLLDKHFSPSAVENFDWDLTKYHIGLD